MTGRFRLGSALICGLSAAACLVIVLHITKIPLEDMIKDYRMMSADQSLLHRIPGMAIQIFKHVLFLPVLLLLVWEDFLGQPKQEGRRFG